MWKPGDRQARPTSCRSLPVDRPEGLAVRAPDEWTMCEWELERSRRRGRCREVVMSGDEGSFFTMILGAGPRDLLEDLRLERPLRVGGDMEEVGVVGLMESEGWRKQEEEEEEEEEDE